MCGHPKNNNLKQNTKKNPIKLFKIIKIKLTLKEILKPNKGNNNFMKEMEIFLN